MRRAVGVITLALALALGCGRAAGPAGAPPTMDKAGLLDTLGALIGATPFTEATVSRLTGATLADTAQSNPYFRVLRSAPGASGGFASVELREPTAQSPGKGGLLILELARPCLTRADVGSRLGAPEDRPPEPPNPEMPPDSPEYDTVPQPWGELRLGYRPSTGCLVSVVLDAVG